MKFEELKDFLAQLPENIVFPESMITFVIEDFHEVVPEEHRQSKDLEFNHRTDKGFIKVGIIPKP